MVDRSTAQEVRKRKLTYLGTEKLDSIYDCIDSIQRAGTLGDFLEFGVALGGSGICMARAMGERQYWGFDVFGMIPPPSEKDGQPVHERYKAIKSGKSAGIDGDPYYGYQTDLLQKVKRNFADFGLDERKLNFVQGLYSDTLPKHPDIKIALAHIDCDWYEPVMDCLKYVWARLSPGGFIVIDDYNDYDGCKRATNEFIVENGLKLLRSKPHAVLTKA